MRQSYRSLIRLMSVLCIFIETIAGCIPNDNHTVQLRFRAGVAPSVLTGRGTTYVVSTTFAPLVEPLETLPRAHHLFNLPLYAAADIAYFIDERLCLFGELGWRYAKSKPHAIPFGQYTVNVHASTINSVASYGGIRLYPTFSFTHIKPFAGLKVGLMHNYAVKGSFFVNETFLTRDTLFFSNTVVSAGFQIGFDIPITKHFQGIVQAELIPTAAPTNNRHIPITLPASSLRSINMGNIGTDLMIPITIGLAYEF